MIVGLKGYKGVGKDTVASYLVEHHGFIQMAFADKLKEAVCNLFGISRQQLEDYKDNRGGSLDYVEVHLDISGMSEYSYGWREFLQRFGTEMGRNTFGQDFWIHRLLSSDEVLETLHAERDIAISDCRFANEARAIRSLNGKVVNIIRPGYEPDGHESEEPIPDGLIDIRIDNNGDLEHLYASTEKALEELYANI